MRITKVLIIVFVSLLISSCSSNCALTGIKNSTIQFGKDIGFIEVNRMKKLITIQPSKSNMNMSSVVPMKLII